MPSSGLTGVREAIGEQSAQSFVDRLQADIEDFDLSFLDKQLKDLQRQGADPAILAEAQRLIAQLEGLEKDQGSFADAARGPQRGQFQQVKLSRLASKPIGSDGAGKDPQLNQVNAQLAQIVRNTKPQLVPRAP